jgi:hypothetical protein
MQMRMVRDLLSDCLVEFAAYAVAAAQLVSRRPDASRIDDGEHFTIDNHAPDLEANSVISEHADAPGDVTRREVHIYGVAFAEFVDNGALSVCEHGPSQKNVVAMLRIRTRYACAPSATLSRPMSTRSI